MIQKHWETGLTGRFPGLDIDDMYHSEYTLNTATELC